MCLPLLGRVFFQLFVCKLKGFNLFHIWEPLLRHPEPSAPFENHLSKSHKQFQGEDLIVGHKKVCSWHKTEELFKWQKFKKKIGSTSIAIPLLLAQAGFSGLAV